MAVQKGQKRGKYKRSQDKQNQADTMEIAEDGMTHQEIAKVLNLPLHVIKRIEVDALRKLQAPTDRNKQLHKYYGINFKPQEEII